jgi:molybdopterin-guanine dinucleotide biosynthesis protein A
VTRAGGIVLAGGRSSRMGLDKALLDRLGVPLVSYVSSVLSEAVDGPVVVVRGAGATLGGLVEGIEVVQDALPDQGPLEGLRAGLAALAGRADVAFVASVDLPLLRVELVRAVMGALEAHPEAQVVVPRVGGHRHPLAAAYRLEVLATVEALLEAGERRLGLVPERCVAVELDAATLLADGALARADPELASLVDVDSPAELRAALARLG